MSVKLSHLVWVFQGELSTTLDAATWLQTTKELRETGLQVTLLSAGRGGEEKIKGVSVTTIRRPDVYFLRQLVYHLGVFWWILKKWNTIDIVFFHQPSALWLLPLILVRKILRKKTPLLVMDSRTVPMESMERATWKDRLRGAFHNQMNWVALHYSDGLTTITQRMADVMQVPPEKLWGTWHSGVNLELFSTATRGRQWPLDGEAVELVYVGYLGFERNLLGMCLAVQHASCDGMKFHFTLVGQGIEQAELEEFAEQSKGLIRVIPSIPHEQIPELLSRMHVGVLPFPDEEKFRVSSPIKLFEYMGAGLPIYATRIDCHTDVVGNGEYTFWANTSDLSGLEDALELVWAQRQRLSEKGSSASAASKGWTWHQSALKLKKALEDGFSKAINRS